MIKLIKKYETFIKYIFSAGISFILDLVLFTFFSKLLGLAIGDISIIVGTILARIISSLVNYFLNKNKVFEHGKDKAMDKETLIKYYILVVIQMGVSAFAVWIIHDVINIEATFIKIFVDIIIFVVNYFVQKIFIFKK